MPVILLPAIVIIWLRLVLGALFIFSSAAKMPDMAGFAAIFAQYKIVPSRLVRPGAFGLVAWEFVAGLFVLVGSFINPRLLLVGAAMILLHLIASTYGVVRAYLNRNIMPNCGCYGTLIKVPISKKKIAENVGWIALAALLLLSV